jgi:hypothetical protein
MMKLSSWFSFLFLLVVNSLFSQQKVIVKGVAAAYPGKKIEIYKILDYLSFKDSLIASTIVSQDSTFEVSFDCNTIQKIILKAYKNQGVLFVQPNTIYEVSVPDRDPYNAYRPHGNQIEIGFLKLNKQDINYKILEFNQWKTSFLAANFSLKSTKTKEFSDSLDLFKKSVQNYYESDTSLFFKTYIRYSIAAIDDINFFGSRSHYEKFDFYLKDVPVSYENEMYMKYFSIFYKNSIGRFPMTLNTKVYKSVIRNSPSSLLSAMGEEYSLKNLRVRELAMIQTLSEMYYDKNYPKTNVLSVLDSVSRFALFKVHASIARNILNRLTELTPGTKAPDFNIGVRDSVSLRNYQTKFLYIQFIDPSSKESVKEFELLRPMFLKYNKYFDFVTVYDSALNISKQQKDYLSKFPWKIAPVASSNDIFAKYQVKSFPQYVLIDNYGIISSIPALGPSPNGDYETIDKVFFSISKRIQLEELEKEKSEIDSIFDK